MTVSPTDHGADAGRHAISWETFLALGPRPSGARPSRRRRRRASLRARFFAGKFAEDAALGIIRKFRGGSAAAAAYALLSLIHRRVLRTITRLPVPPETGGAAPGGHGRPRLGVHPGETFVVEYDPSWKQRSEAEASLLREFLGESCGPIHHIGSTAVPGLPAKPIIDLALGLPAADYDRNLQRTIAALQKIGYRYLGDRGRRGGHYLEKVCFSIRTHAVQLHPADSHDLRELLRFRDLLCADFFLAEAYARVKFALAAAIGDDRRIYVWYKAHWIHELLLDDSAKEAWGNHLLAQNPPTLGQMYWRRRSGVA